MFSHLSQEQGKSVCSLHFHPGARQECLLSPLPSNIVLEVLASAIEQEEKAMQTEEQKGETGLFMDSLPPTGAGAIQRRSNSLSNKLDIHKQMKGEKKKEDNLDLYLMLHPKIKSKWMNHRPKCKTRTIQTQGRTSLNSDKAKISYIPCGKHNP